MKRGSTHFLRLAIAALGAGALTICGLTFMPLIHRDTGGYGPLVLIMYLSAIPFFVALWQTLKLLTYIDKNKAFSKLSVAALKKVKYCALVFSVLYMFNLPFFYRLAQNDDAPGVMLLGLIAVGASLVIAVSAGVLEKLLQNVIDIKSENDLTV